MDEKQIENGQWGILELMGRKVVAGYLSRDEWQGHAMVRVDVPATSEFPAFTQVYGPQAVYCISYVSEEVAKLVAEHNRSNPISVYVPDLDAGRKAMRENDRLREKYNEMRAELLRIKGLPSPGDPSTDPTRLDEDQGDEDDDDGEDSIPF